jgi:hypothetical protein
MQSENGSSFIIKGAVLGLGICAFICCAMMSAHIDRSSANASNAWKRLQASSSVLSARTLECAKLLDRGKYAKKLELFDQVFDMRGKMLGSANTKGGMELVKALEGKIKETLSFISGTSRDLHGLSWDTYVDWSEKMAAAIHDYHMAKMEYNDKAHNYNELTSGFPYNAIAEVRRLAQLPEAGDLPDDLLSLP